MRCSTAVTIGFALKTANTKNLPLKTIIHHRPSRQSHTVPEANFSHIEIPAVKKWLVFTNTYCPMVASGHLGCQILSGSYMRVLFID